MLYNGLKISEYEMHLQRIFRQLIIRDMPKRILAIILLKRYALLIKKQTNKYKEKLLILQ